MSSMKKSVSTVLFAAVVACAPAAGSDDTPPPPAKTSVKVAPKASATRVEVAKVRPWKPSLELSLPGEVEGSREAILASAIGGYVERVLAQDGAEVRAGQTIAWVNRAVMEAQLDQAKAALDLAKIELESTTRAGKSLPRARREAAEVRVRAAEASYKLAEIQVSRAYVRAPFSGVIANVAVEQGEVIPPGGPVARLIQLDPIQISVSVSDRDVVTMKPGLPVRVALDARSELFDGRIERISPAADIKTRTFVVEVEVENKEVRLLPGMIASVRMSIEQDDEALAIPQYVLVTRREGNGVFVHENGVAHWRPAKLGRVIRDQVVIESGLEVGAEVIVTGHRELVDGDRVLVAREGECCRDGKIVYAKQD